MVRGMTSTCLVLVLAATTSAGVQAQQDYGYGQNNQDNGYGAAPQGGQGQSHYDAAPTAAAPAAPPTAPQGGQYQQGLGQSLGGQSHAPTSGGASSLQFDPNAAAPIMHPGQQQQGGGNYQPQPQHFGNSQPQPQGGNYFDSAPTSGGQPSSGGGHMVNPMATLMGGITNSLHQQQGGGFNGGGGYSNQPLMSHGQVNSQVLSMDSKEVVSGLIESFMHKYQLQPGEKACLENNIETLTGSVMGVVGDVATAIKALIAGHGSVSQNSQGSLVSAGMDSAMKITGLVSSATGLAKGCVHGDALQMLKDTAHHMVNGTYLRHRFLVNGVDIAHDLADAVVSFEHHDFHKFGVDIGTSLRKILLSNSNHAVRLPEGVPEEVIIQQTTDGLMRGFFVAGAAMDIRDTARPDVNIHVNLHRCLAQNSEFFKEIWMGLWNLIAQLSAGTAGSGFKNMFSANHGGNGGQPKWAGEMMVAMMQFPMALSKCGINAGDQHMLMEAIQTIGNLKVHFTFPQDQIQAEAATAKMAKAVEAWTNWNFEQFGYELGKVFRELIMLAFPQKYSIDASGRLQANLDLDKEPRSFSSAVVIIGGAAVSLFIALAVVRTRRSSPKEVPEHMVPITDMEDGEELELVE